MVLNNLAKSLKLKQGIEGFSAFLLLFHRGSAR